MNQIFRFAIFFALAACSFATTAQNHSEDIFFCGYSERHSGAELCNYLQTNFFTTNEVAERAVDRILEPLGLPRNFVLVSCPNIKNAVAVTPKDGLRYIIYDNAFMASVDRAAPDWAALSILAHEVGHHLCGHTLKASSDLADSRKKELEADEFSGFVLAKLGATLAQAQAAMATLASDKDDTYSTHPSRPKRLAAIEKGFNKAKGQTKPENVQSKPGAETAFTLAMKLAAEGNYRGAIEQYDVVIRSNPAVFQAWYNRGLAKNELGQYASAIVDFDETIRLNSKFSDAYIGKGLAHYHQKNYHSAITQYDSAIRLSPSSYLAWFNRSVANYSLKNYRDVITDCDRVISLKPDYAGAYTNRGLAKQQLGDQAGGQADIDKGEQLKKPGSTPGNTGGSANDARMAEAHHISGTMKLDAGDKAGACNDFRKGCQLGSVKCCVAVTVNNCP